MAERTARRRRVAQPRYRYSTKPVLRIHDILGWIRIRIWIRGSMPLTNGYGCGSGSCYFRYWPSQDVNKNFFFVKVVFLLTFWRFMYIIFKDQKSKRNHKAVGIKVFLTIFAWWKMDPGPDPNLWLMYPDPGGPKTNGSGSETPPAIQCYGLSFACRLAYFV